MKVFKGFEALDFVLKNKKAILHNKKGSLLKYDERTQRLVVKTKSYMEDFLVINDRTMLEEWYSEEKKKVLVRIYENEKLIDVQIHKCFNIEDNIEKLDNGIKNYYYNKFNKFVDIKCEFFA